MSRTAIQMFLQHILGGIKSVMATSLKFGQAKTQPYPEENRFDRQILTAGLDEPTELVVLDNGKVLFSERKGALKLYDPDKKSVKVVANFPVFTKFEYGLMGLNIDPNFKQNKWVYAYYSPLTGKTVADTAQHLSRFVYDDVKDTLLLNTEKVLLTIPVKRDGCCHTGGSIAWDRKGNLYLSAGDDTNPFNSNGFAPIDERPGRGAGMPALRRATPTTCAEKSCVSTPKPMVRIPFPKETCFRKEPIKPGPKFT